MAWLDDNLERFSPCDRTGVVIARVKPFAELAFVGGLLMGRPRSDFRRLVGLRDSLSRCSKFIRRELQHPAFSELPRTRPYVSYGAVLGYLMLRASGYRDECYEDTLRRLQRWGFPSALESAPFRKMDQAYVYWRAGMQPRPRWRALYRDTTLHRCKRLTYFDKAAVYSITHTVMYLTGVGYQSAPLPQSELARIGSVVGCLLFDAWRLQDWDLTGELLINLRALGVGDSSLSAEASRALCDAALPCGAVPANDAARDRLNGVTGDALADALFRECYHTTLVALLHAAIALR